MAKRTMKEFFGPENWPETLQDFLDGVKELSVDERAELARMIKEL